MCERVHVYLSSVQRTTDVKSVRRTYKWGHVRFLHRTTCSYDILVGFSVTLSNPLLLACTVDVVYRRSHGSFVVLLVRICIWPL